MSYFVMMTAHHINQGKRCQLNEVLVEAGANMVIVGTRTTTKNGDQLIALSGCGSTSDIHPGRPYTYTQDTGSGYQNVRQTFTPSYVLKLDVDVITECNHKPIDNATLLHIFNMKVLPFVMK